MPSVARMLLVENDRKNGDLLNDTLSTRGARNGVSGSWESRTTLFPAELALRLQ
jgi:hypothetical protein